MVSTVLGCNSSAISSRKWLFNPFADLLFCCGGLTWLLVGIHYVFNPASFQSGPNAKELIPLITAMGTILLSDTHNAATLFRLYGSERLRQKHGGLAWSGAFIAAFLSLSLLCSPVLLSICARIYLILVVYHVLAQIYGLCMMYCRMHDCKLSYGQILQLKLGINCLSVYAVLCQFVYVDKFRHSFFGVALPVWSGLSEPILYAVLGSACILLSSFACSLAFKRVLLPAPVLMLLSTGLLIAALVHCASGVLSLYIPIFFHGLQYVLLNLSEHLKQDQALVQKATSSIALGYFAKLLALTLIMFGLLPQFISMIFQLRFETVFLAIFLGLNFHHIACDSLIWSKGKAA